MTPLPSAPVLARSRRVGLVLSTLVLAACTSGDRMRPDDTMSPATTADSGAVLEGEEQIAWSSEVVEGTITEITEQLTFGTDGRAERVLRFTPDGALTEYHEVRTQSAPDSAGLAAPTRVELVVRMAGDSVVSQSRTADGVATALQPDDLDIIRRHAAATLQRLRLPDTSDAARRD